MKKENLETRVTSLSEGQKVWLGLAVVGMFSSFWLLFKVGKVWQDMKQKEIKVKELVIKANDVDVLLTEKQIFGEKIVQLREFFLEGEVGVAMAAEGMEKMANEAGVTLTLSFEDFPEQVDVGGVYNQGLWMYVEVEGSYQRVLDWVRRVEELPYFIRLSEVKIGLAKLSPGIKGEFRGVLFLKNE